MAALKNHLFGWTRTDTPPKLSGWYFAFIDGESYLSHHARMRWMYFRSSNGTWDSNGRKISHWMDIQRPADA